MNTSQDVSIALPEYRQFIEQLKSRVLSARLCAARAVNCDLILLYWDIGRGIVEKQQTLGWGDAIVEMVAADLRRMFPEMRGFSPSNVWRMRQFVLLHARTDFLAQAARELKNGSEESKQEHILAQVARELLSQIPWWHHVELMAKVKEPGAYFYYLRATARFGWSRNVLLNQIKAEAWEQLNNLDFKSVEFDGIRMQTGLNSFTLTPKQWIDFVDISNLRKSAQSVDKTSNDNPRASASSAQSAFYFIPSAFICVHLRLIFVSLSDRIRKIRFKLFPVKPQIEQAINNQAHSCLNLLENKPQINADERRFVNLNIQQVSETYHENSLTESMQSSAMPVITYEKAAASRLRTRMTRITRICTDTFSSASFPQSAFYRIYSLIDEYKNPQISQIRADYFGMNSFLSLHVVGDLICRI